MTAPAWIAIAGLFVTIAIQTVGLAFWLGGLSARMRNIEGRPGNDDCGVQLAAMNATLIAMEKGVERRFADLEHTVRNLLQIRPASRRKPSE